MTVCTFDTTKLIIGILVSIFAPFFLYKFVLHKHIKQKWVSILISIILFVILLYVTSIDIEVCTVGHYIGPGGKEVIM